MCDSSPPPPSYELSQQGHDQKIVEKKLQDLLLSKIPIHDIEEEHDGEDSKDSKETEKKQPLFQAPVQPLHIQKRAPRGARPLPPSPADAHSRSRSTNINLIGPLAEETEHQDHRAIISPPPPFTVVGPSLDGPPYEYLMYHASGSAAPSPFSTPNRTSVNPPPVRRGQHRPSSSYSPAEPYAESSYRRVSQGAYLEPSSLKNATPPGKSSTATRLSFNPSIAYTTSSNDMYDPWERISDSTAVNATSLYSSAVSSYLHPASAVNPSPRASYIGVRPKNRYSTPPRPSSSVEVLTPVGSPGQPALQSNSPYIPNYATSHQSLPRYTRPKSSQGGHVRWATSEAEIFRDIYP